MNNIDNQLIIGTNAVGHDSSVVHFDAVSGDIFALDNERVNRVKHDGTGIKDCFNELLRVRGIDINGSSLELNEVYAYEEAFTQAYLLEKQVQLEIKRVFRCVYIKDIHAIMRLPFYKKIVAYVQAFPRSWKLLWINPLQHFLRLATLVVKKQFNIRYVSSNSNLRWYMSREMSAIGWKLPSVLFHDHHLCHCIAAYYFAPFDRCLSISLDFSGDGYFSKVFRCESGRTQQVAASPVIWVGYGYLSIGKVYSSITQYLGYMPNSDEGKVEALAAFGYKDNELYQSLMDKTKVDKDLSIIIDTSVMGLLQYPYLDGIKAMVGAEGIAAAVQGYLEDCMTDYIGRIMDRFKLYDVCFSGGTFCNVKLNMSIFENTKIRGHYVFPAMTDSGTAIGSLILRLVEKGLVNPGTFKTQRYRLPYWGSAATADEISAAVIKFAAQIESVVLGDFWPEAIADMVCDGKIGAIFQGRCEFGPRALGNRSILADARSEESRKRINKIIKGRPMFQPFCPSVLEEDRCELFERSYPNKHMTCAFQMKDLYSKQFPSGVHVDGTGRPQFVEEKDNPNFYRVLKQVKKRIGRGILINTSFNKHGRTMVLTPEQAIVDFLDSQMDFLCIEGTLITRKK